MSDNVGYNIAFLTNSEQEIVEKIVTSTDDILITAVNSALLKEEKDKHPYSEIPEAQIISILSSGKTKKKKTGTGGIVLSKDIVSQYFENKNQSEINSIIKTALQQYYATVENTQEDEQNDENR